jgi:hypothetical protein
MENAAMGESVVIVFCRVLLVALLGMLGSCAELRKAGEQRFADSMTAHLVEHKHKIKPTDIAACMALRPDLPPASTMTGEPSYTPNIFFTCVMNRTHHYGGGITLLPATFMAYDVRATYSEPAGGRQRKVTEAKFVCLFQITDAGNKAFPPSPRDDIFGGRIIPEKLYAHHPCMKMPDAYQHTSRGELVR